MIKKSLFILLFSVIQSLVFSFLFYPNLLSLSFFTTLDLGYIYTNVKLCSKEEIIQENKKIFIDARLKKEYEEGHLPSAINLPYEKVVPNKPIEEKILKKIPKQLKIIVYADGVEDEAAKVVADALFKSGYKNVKIAPWNWKEIKELCKDY